MKISNILSRRNRILLRELVITDFKLRYQGSVLGYLWSLLKPLMLFAILYIVFVHFLRFGSDIEHFPVYLLLGVVMWSFFVEATSQGMQAIVSRGDLIRKINFPKYIIVISGTLSALINLLLNLIVVFIFVVVNGVDLNWSALLVPINILELYVFSLAIAFLLAALYVKYRDISHIWEIFLQGAFYATPILYPISMVAVQSEFAAKALLLNPVAQVIQDARYNLISHQTVTVWSYIDKTWVQLVPIVSIVLIAVLAGWYFKKTQKYFAENV
ncbi:ABC transporter permease [Candidatus Saccharibacteria bacterium]|nr:MAG: ABC transporter permease [Candidatus Saccharibacteria bacterium]